VGFHEFNGVKKRGITNVAFMPEEYSLKDCYPERIFYFQDFVTQFFKGSIQLANRAYYFKKIKK